MLKRIQGYRTFIVGWLMLIAAAVLFALGDLPPAEALNWVFEALGLLGLRAGINTVAGGVPVDHDQLATGMVRELVNRYAGKGQP
jgi:hypothetical protein